MRIRTEQRNTHYAEIDGVEVELEFQPAYEGYMLHERIAGKLVVAYLVQDDDRSVEDLMDGDGVGSLYSFHRHAPKGDADKAVDAIGNNIDAVLLDCYDHGHQRWSLSGDGMQCLFDTARGAGVWVPDEHLVEYLVEFKGAERRAQAVGFCKQFLETYNDCLAGDVYGCVVATFEQDAHDEDVWSQTSEDACWGFVGSKYAMETLQSEFFAPAVEAIGEVA